MSRKSELDPAKAITEIYGQNVFSFKTMRNYLSDKAINSLKETMEKGKSLNPAIADEVADAMKNWAVSKGATHFTHWFQPLTGTTAEKHDSFIVPDSEGGVILQFSGKELIQGEPDASSFPSGGLRSTFEARGYTAWDPTSPAFIKEGENGATLCIPTVFCGYHGDSLDKKTPLLRSMEALSEQVCRLGRLFKIKDGGRKAYATLGAEQEYFLIDKAFYESRLDLIQTGRTIFGKAPAKHQQMEDHYFGAIKDRVMTFMDDFDRELWKLGIPAKTRHNEVCPGQFEVASVYEGLNLSVDHNMMLMEVLRKVAEDHDFVCLLHEKPFAGVNGSGKHNNWSIKGPDGKNWLSPGDNPHDNAKFLTLICALIKAVDTHAEILRASVATAGNDHRLGANEAPPAILSIFLGEQLTGVIGQIERGEAKTSKSGGFIKIGVSSLPTLPRDATDRNRTSPFAFTGNKFEFRAVGSNQNCAGPNIVLNTIVAAAIDDICASLEKDVSAKKEFNKSLQKILRKIVKEHKRILFNGDNYTKAWHSEAKKRGLSNLKTTPESLKILLDVKTVKLFEKYKVLSEKELKSRFEVYQKEYDEIIQVESEVAVTIAKTQVINAALEYQSELAETINAVSKVDRKNALKSTKALLSEVCAKTEGALVSISGLEKAIKKGSSKEKITATVKLRGFVDALEGLVPDEKWPLATYAEMMFMM